MARPTCRAVAMLALAYRELAGAYDGVDLSFGAKVVHDLLPPEEDALFEVMAHPDVLLALLPELADVAPVRAEALLHAFPPEGGPPTREWARSFVVRWDAVEREMATLACLGVARI